MLPIFHGSPDLALEVARQAEAAGIDGVFCYDHLWPMGAPGRPAMAPFPVLAAVAARTRRISLGTLVARVGLVPDEVLVAEFATLWPSAPGRVVAGLGHRRPPERRRERGLRRRLRSRPGAPGVAGPLCRRAGLARAPGVDRRRGVPDPRGGRGNGGGGEPVGGPADEVAGQAVRTEVTWAGPAPAGGSSDGGAVADLVATMAGAGADWVVLGWPAPVGALAASGARWRAG